MIPSTLACLLTLPLLSHASQQYQPIRLSKVESLTLRGNGAMTHHRRVPAVSQLKCISNKKICKLYDIDVMRCTNQGSAYGEEDIQWSCKASLPDTLKLGSTDVICEGYNYAEDEYVLKGSCGVEYRLALTEKGHQRYPDLSDGSGWFDDGKGGGTDLSAIIFGVIFIAILGWIIYSACFAAQNRQRPQRRRGPGFGGGGWHPGWGPDQDPPPPYPGTKPSDQQQGWQPGFWTGLAGGAAAGYMAGNRNQNRYNHNNGYGSVGRNSGWGGSSNGRSSSSSSGSSARHESTGFGSTSRR